MPDTTSVSASEGSTFRAAGTVAEKIEKARLELLDLTTRNRLLHTPRTGRAKTIEVVSELAEAMYKTLVAEGKRFTFAAGRLDPAAAELSEVIPAPLEDEHLDPDLVNQPEVELDETGRVLSHWDSQLQTRMTSAGLQKRLVDLFIDAKTVEEEQGVNILYLAIGFLRWRAPKSPDQDRFAPLVLVPVRLERSNAGEKFHLRWSGEDVQTNLSLQLHLRREFAMKLPDITDAEGFGITAYLQEIASLVSERAHWGVELDDAVLGLFSFAKFMMYRDLEGSEWAHVGGFQALPSLRGVVSEGFPGAQLTDDATPIDDVISPAQMVHVVDCDSSQSLVVFDVQKGHSILVQGPPGTGKSQTITNIIASAIAEKKKVLFVAEKMAALEVVKRRLDHIGIGVACLELHSHKANKRSLLEELRNTWQLGTPKFQDGRVNLLQLTEARDALNAHAVRLHEALEPSALTPYDVFGHLVRLRRAGHTTRQVQLDNPTRWPPHEKLAREKLLLDLTARVDSMGLPARHAWNGVGITGLTPNERDRLIAAVATHTSELTNWRSDFDALRRELDLAPAEYFKEMREPIERAEILLAAPPLGADALVSAIWDDPGAVEGLIEELADAQRLRSQCAEVSEAGALDADWTASKHALGGLSAEFVVGNELSTLASVFALSERLLPDATRLAQLLREEHALTLDSAAHLCAIGERASSVPQIEREALVAHIWDRGIDSIEELIEAVEHVQGAKGRLNSVFREAAWGRDWEEARGHLATLGSSWLRFFNGNWRRSNREVRAQLASPKLPAPQVLARIDELISAQLAQRKIAERDGQGQEGFGIQWERERSDPAFLRGVVAWMRSLRPLGAGVRERLAEVGDRQLASELAARIKPTLDEIRERLTPISEALIAADCKPWEEETVLRRVPLTLIRETTQRWASAYAQTALIRNRDSLMLGGALADIALIEQTQAALDAIERAAPRRQATLGPLWQGLDTDLVSVHAAAGWMREHAALRSLAARVEDPASLITQGHAAEGRAKELVRELHSLFGSLHFTGNDVVATQPREASLAGLTELLHRWEEDSEGLPQWVQYQGEPIRRMRGAWATW